MSSTVVWRRNTQTSLEHCVFDLNRYGWEARGKVIQAGETPLLVEYWIGCDLDGRTRRVYVAAIQAGADLSLVMLTDPEGEWKINGQPRPDLSGCPDVDLGISPLTNTLPIRRLHLAVGQSGEAAAAWVSFPDLSVSPLRQRYTRLSEYRYQYESLEDGFQTVIEVDELGLVVRYGDEWERVAEDKDAKSGLVAI